jgi:hypothetical protein
MNLQPQWHWELPRIRIAKKQSDRNTHGNDVESLWYCNAGILELSFTVLFDYYNSIIATLGLLANWGKHSSAVAHEIPQFSPYFAGVQLFTFFDEHNCVQNTVVSPALANVFNLSH